MTNKPSNWVPEEKILREYFDKKGINKLVPEYMPGETTEKVLEVLDSTQKTMKSNCNIDHPLTIKFDEYNLWEPTCPDIIVNTQWVLSETEPEACSYKWKWYYNDLWAIKEAEFLGKRLPTKEELEKIVEPYWNNGGELSKELWLPFDWFKWWDDWESHSKPYNANYWLNKSSDGNAYVLNFSNSHISIVKAVELNRGFSVRLVS